LAGVVAEVVTVSVAVPEPPATEGGTKAQVGAGVTTGVMLLHDSATVPVKLLRGAMVMVEVEVPPATIEAGARAEAAIVKSGAGGGAFTVSPTEVLWVNSPAVPVTVTLEVAAGVVVSVLMVSVDGVPGVTDAGTKSQVAPLGRLAPLQVRVTEPVKPFRALIDTV